MTPRATGAPLLEARGLTKAYGAGTVLDGVSFAAAPNTVVGIVGENGAGKSTLFNILCGVTQPDAGEMSLGGRPFRPRNLAEANRAGVSRVFQEQALIPHVRVYENLLLGHEALFCHGPLVRQRAMLDVARRILSLARLEAIDPGAPTSALSFSKRQLVEIARACFTPREVLGVEQGVVLLDEPTASLLKEEERAFFDMIGRLRAHASVLFVSHRLTEVLQVSDRVLVLKDGCLVAELDPASTSQRELHSLMVGRERDADYYHERRQRDVRGGPVVLRARGRTRAGAFTDVSLEVRAGEVLGIGGLLESGKEALGRALAGLLPLTGGAIELAGAPLRAPTAARLVARGLGYVPAERLADGMIPDFPIAWNMSLASGADLMAGPLGTWNIAREQDLAARFIDLLRIRGGTPARSCRALSGGNQQKVVLGRWLCRDLRVLILDNPTRGVDAGAKEEIYGLLRDLTDRGVAVVLITDELLELIGLSDRIAILRRGRVAGVVDAAGRKPDEQAMIRLMLASESDAVWSVGTDRPSAAVPA